MNAHFLFVAGAVVFGRPPTVCGTATVRDPMLQAGNEVAEEPTSEELLQRRWPMPFRATVLPSGSISDASAPGLPVLHRPRFHQRASLSEEPAKIKSDEEPRRSFCEPGNGWAMDFEDEFSGDQLDTSTWAPIMSSGKMSHVAPVDGLNVTACRRAECRADNIEVSRGALRLRSDRSDTNHLEFSTGAVTTKGHRAWSDNEPYRLCVSAKLPAGGSNKGLWPAIWMLPENGVSEQCLDEGEVDILEMINGDGKAYSTYHFLSSWPEKSCGDFDTYHKSVAHAEQPAAWGSSFHEYAIERTSDRIDFVLDGQVVRTVTTDRSKGRVLSHSPFYLIINTAIGGSWPGDPDHSTSMPVEHAIDYVRVVRQTSKNKSEKASFARRQQRREAHQTE